MKLEFENTNASEGLGRLIIQSTPITGNIVNAESLGSILSITFDQLELLPVHFEILSRRFMRIRIDLTSYQPTSKELQYIAKFIERARYVEIIIEDDRKVSEIEPIVAPFILPPKLRYLTLKGRAVSELAESNN